MRARIALVSLARPPLTPLSAFPRAPDSFNDLQWFALVFTCGRGWRGRVHERMHTLQHTIKVAGEDREGWTR